MGEEVDPFVKRVVTVEPGNVVIFKYTAGSLPADIAEDLKAKLAAKMGPISFILVDKDFDITVLKQSKNGHGPLIA